MFSPTYISSIVVVIIALLQIFKIKLLPEDLTPIITGILAFVILFRRFQKHDISIYGKKIQKA